MNAPVKDQLIEVPSGYGRRAESAPLPALQPPSAGALLQAITQAVSNPQLNIENVERFFRMYQDTVKLEAQAAYNAAMSRAQSQMFTIVNDRVNEHTRSGYATRRAINRVIVPIYTAEGLSVEFDTETKNNLDPVPEGMIRIVARVAHAAGHHERRHIDLFPDDSGAQGKVNKTRVQATGSTSEYGCRYLLKLIFNLATGDEEDNDGNSRKGALATAQAVEFEGAIDTEETSEGLQEIWKRIAETCRKSGDAEAHAAFKARVMEKLEKLKKAGK